MVRRNLIANYIGQGWAAVMGFTFIPLYIKYLGVEAYGLIGLFAAMQAWMVLLDAGMTPTLTREMARFTAGAHSPQTIRNLLRSIEIPCFGIAALIALTLWAGSGYLSTHWLNAEHLSTAEVARAISMMALVVALRFCEGLYRGSLFGLQKQAWYNAVYATFATLRHGGAVAVLIFVSPTIEAFFLWQALISLLSVALFAARVHKELPKPPAPARFSVQALKDVWRFAAGVLGITFLALLLTQVDKILLSRLLSLTNFGYYSLAATVAGTFYMIVGPITQALYPRVVELVTQADQAGLSSLYHKGAQLVTASTAPAVLLLSIFPANVIYMWSGDVSLAEHTAPILSVLVLGTFLNSLMWMPYQLQLAHGWTTLTLKSNIIAVGILIPALFWVVPRYGALGAAAIWVALNTGYVLLVIYFMHRKLLLAERSRWYLSDILAPIAGALGMILLARLFQPAADSSRIGWFAFFMIVGILAVLAATLAAGELRPRLIMITQKVYRRLSS